MDVIEKKSIQRQYSQPAVGGNKAQSQTRRRKKKKIYFNIYIQYILSLKYPTLNIIIQFYVKKMMYRVHYTHSTKKKVMERRRNRLNEDEEESVVRIVSEGR